MKLLVVRLFLGSKISLGVKCETSIVAWIGYILPEVSGIKKWCRLANGPIWIVSGSNIYGVLKVKCSANLGRVVVISYHDFLPLHSRTVCPSVREESFSLPAKFHPHKKKEVHQTQVGSTSDTTQVHRFSFWRNRCPKKKGWRVASPWLGDFRSKKTSVESGGAAVSVGLSLEGTLGFCGPLWLSSSPCYFDSVNWFGSRSLKQARQNVKTRWA